jgi:hypothetical protein
LRPPPIIYQRCENQTLPVGSVASLPCLASSEPTPVVYWFNGTNALTGKHSRVTLLQSGALQIAGLLNIRRMLRVLGLIAYYRLEYYTLRHELPIFVLSETPLGDMLQRSRDTFELKSDSIRRNTSEKLAVFPSKTGLNSFIHV